MKAACQLILILTLALTYNQVSYAKVRDIREIKLGPKQTEAITKDAPVKNISLSSDGKRAAILGQQFVWFWDFDKKILSKLTSFSTSDQMSHILFLDTNAVAVSGPRQLQIVDTETQTASIIWQAEQTQGTTINLERSGNSLVLLHTEGVFKYDLAEAKREKIFGAGLFKKDDKAVIGDNESELWIIRDFRLLRKSIQDQKVRSILIHKGTQPLRSLAFVDGEVWVANLNTVVRFNVDGKFLSAIPVESNRKLLRMDIQPQRHSYLFTDGLIEIFELSTKEHVQYRLPQELRTAVQDISVSGPVLGVTSKQEPRFFLTL